MLLAAIIRAMMAGKLLPDYTGQLPTTVSYGKKKYLHFLLQIISPTTFLNIVL
jgi:hypothetical protein